ncbi:unnamed protein product [Effrenium voratum]|uniref:AB hydrolase-1 domain-containing protein n=1 Tax=Effrenium voratum TaxID=2562239 RepID=A0AA36MP24_9DINO|nr:unnamed protein product [Effrenium voratum]CAJ1419911.1 unnamed protein product [Effrenium voratum]
MARRCCCCSCATAWAIVALLVALLVGLCFSAASVAEGFLEPMPPAEELPAGARYFHRPSDDGRLEWHEYGSTRPEARVWVLVHGAVSTGGVFHIFPGFDRRMREMEVRVIAPTMPGWGASDPYTPVFEMTGGTWLERWSTDALALLNSLGVDQFTVSGMSLGGPPGLALAAAAQRQHRLVAVAALIANMWNHRGFDIVESISYTLLERLAIEALQGRHLGSVAAVLMRKMILGTANFSASPMVPEDVTWDRGFWGADLQRSVRYQLAGQVQSNRLAFIHTPGPLLDWAAFNASVPVYVFYGDKDDVCPPVMAAHAATMLPWATRVEFHGTHFHLDVFRVAQELFGGA